MGWFSGRKDDSLSETIERDFVDTVTAPLGLVLDALDVLRSGGMSKSSSSPDSRSDRDDNRDSRSGGGGCHCDCDH